MNILLAAMSLDIGGAETHVLSLAKELKILGYNPVVMSAGGIYVKELEAENIKHFYAPLVQKDIKSIVKSLKEMRQVIKSEKIDIIHSHGRIPALIGKIISKLFKLPFMTTAHAQSTHEGLYRYMSFWGEEVICVSEDIKNHLINNFGVNKDRITIITNGIDIEKFAPEKDTSKLYEELGLSEESKKIVYISRMEGELAELAKLVIEIGQELKEEKEKIDLIIAGAGEDFEKISELATKENGRLKETYLHVLGRRTDIPDIMSLADVAICVARTAIEAMACEKPVILAGGEGYMGLLTKENLEVAISNNFTGRTVDNNMSKDSLKKEIIKALYDLQNEDILELGKLGRNTVMKNFSIKAMTKETLVIYDRLLIRRNSN